MKSPEEEPTEHRVHDRGLGCWEMRWTVSGGSDKETCEFGETLCRVLRVMGSLWRLAKPASVLTQLQF